MYPTHQHTLLLHDLRVTKMNRSVCSRLNVNTSMPTTSSTPKSNPVINVIGVKKWNRLSKSTQSVTQEITKLLNSKDEYPGRTLTDFDSADYDRFVRDGERELCYGHLIQGFKVRNDPFSVVPGISVFMPSDEHQGGVDFLYECLATAMVTGDLGSPWVYVKISSAISDTPSPGGGRKFRPDVGFRRLGRKIPYFTIEVNWKRHTREDARRQLLVPIELYRGEIKGGMLVYFSLNNWYAEVYRYVNRATDGDDIYIPDGIADIEGERELMRQALDESDDDFVVYLQEGKSYSLLSNNNTPGEDVPLSMFDLFSENYKQIVLHDNMRRPDATFWLDHNIFKGIFEQFPLVV